MTKATLSPAQLSPVLAPLDFFAGAGLKRWLLARFGIIVVGKFLFTNCALPLPERWACHPAIRDDCNSLK